MEDKKSIENELDFIEALEDAEELYFIEALEDAKKLGFKEELEDSEEPEDVREFMDIMAMAIRERKARNLARNHTIDPGKLRIAEEIYDGVKDAFLDIDLAELKLQKSPEYDCLNIIAYVTVIEMNKEYKKKFAELVLMSDSINIYPTNDDLMCIDFEIRSAYLESRKSDEE